MVQSRLPVLAAVSRDDEVRLQMWVFLAEGRDSVQQTLDNGFQN